MKKGKIVNPYNTHKKVVQCLLPRTISNQKSSDSSFLFILALSVTKENCNRSLFLLINKEKWTRTQREGEKGKIEKIKIKKKKGNRGRVENERGDSGVKGDPKRICVKTEKCIETLSSSFTSCSITRAFSRTPAWGQGAAFKRCNIFFFLLSPSLFLSLFIP